VIDAKFARANSNIIRGSMCYVVSARVFVAAWPAVHTHPAQTPRVRHRRRVRTLSKHMSDSTMKFGLIGTVSCPPAAAPPPVRASIARCTCVDPAPHTVGPRSAAGWHLCHISAYLSCVCTGLTARTGAYLSENARISAACAQVSPPPIPRTGPVSGGREDCA